ncbi:MAG: riboflavin kinase [Oscillospiraceae bacterium]
MTNIGVRPTVEGRSVTVEPWILDYDGDLYGREITLEFYRFLRPERKFPSLGRPESGNSPQRRGNESLLWGITPCFIRGNAV